MFKFFLLEKKFELKIHHDKKTLEILNEMSLKCFFDAAGFVNCLIICSFIVSFSKNKVTFKIIINIITIYKHYHVYKEFYKINMYVGIYEK